MKTADPDAGPRPRPAPRVDGGSRPDARCFPAMSAAELPLRKQDLDPDPLRQFARWLEAARASDIAEPEAMTLATAGADGAPSARMVLLKRFDERGYAFFTNYDSRKGRELEENPQAALLFHWQPLGRQVRIEGRVARLERRVIEGYARSRSRESQLSALASPEPSRARTGVARGAGRRARPPSRRQRRAGWRRLGRVRARRRRTSSGSTTPTGCTTAFATCRRPAAAGRSSAWGRSSAVWMGLDPHPVVALAHTQLVGRAAGDREPSLRAPITLNG